MSELHSAVRSGSVAAIRKLLESKPDVNARDEQGRTPLHRLLERGSEHFGIARLLLKAGANPDLPDQEGVTAREEARTSGLKLFPTRKIPPHAQLPAARPWKAPRRWTWLDALRWSPVLIMLLLLVVCITHPPQFRAPEGHQAGPAQWPRHYATAQQKFRQREYADAARYAQAALDCDRPFDEKKTEVKWLALESYLRAERPEQAWPIAKGMPSTPRLRSMQGRLLTAGQAKNERLLAEGRAWLQRHEHGRATASAQEARALSKALGMNTSTADLLLNDINNDQRRIHESAAEHRRELAAQREEEAAERRRQRYRYYTRAYSAPLVPAAQPLPAGAYPSARPAKKKFRDNSRF